MPETIIPNCNNCGAQLKERKTKNNRTIWACPNWRADGKGCLGEIYDPHQEDERKRIFPRVVIRNNVASRSEKGKFRTVEVYENGDMRCNCFAGDMNKFCYHQQKTGKWLKELLKKIEKENKVDFNTLELKEKSHGTKNLGTQTDTRVGGNIKEVRTSSKDEGKKQDPH